MNPPSERILITGARGMLGSDITLALAEREQAAIAMDRNSLDILDPKQIESVFDQHRPTIVINCAAYTDVDKAESEREKAYALNAIGPANLVSACSARGIRLVHFSTDHVFSGNGNTPWSEDDAPEPANYYGESKLGGDLAVLKYERSLVARVQWLYGKKKNRFTTLRDKKVFTPFNDQFGAPTWTRDIAHIALDLMERRATGLYHYAYDDYGSWFDVYRLAKSVLNLPTELVGKRSEEVSLPAKRPKFGVMSNAKLRKFLDRPKLGSWEAQLTKFLTEMPLRSL